MTSREPFTRIRYEPPRSAAAHGSSNEAVAPPEPARAAIPRTLGPYGRPAWRQPSGVVPWALLKDLTK